MQPTQRSNTNNNSNKEKKTLDPEIQKVLEALKQNWVITDADDEQYEDADEMKNSHTDLTLVSKALRGDTTELPAIYTGVFRRSLRKSNYVLSSRYSSYDAKTSIKFGDMVSPSILQQYVSQGATSFTLSSIDINYFASPLAEASTGVSNLLYVSGDESYNYQLLPIHSASSTTMLLDTVLPVSSTISNTVVLTIDVSQTSLRRIFNDDDRHGSNGLDAGFDVSVFFRIYINGIGQEVRRRPARFTTGSDGVFL